MNDKPPSTNGPGSTGVFKRVIRAFKGEPWSREEIHDLLQQAESVFEPEEQEMLNNVLEVAETQVRDVMIPRSQMVVIEQDHSKDEMLKVTTSLGIASFDKDIMNIADLIERADKAMYASKAAGRNRVTVDDTKSVAKSVAAANAKPRAKKAS